MDNQKSVEVTKPETTAQEYYADAKQTITLGVRNLIRAFPLPLFMIDSILQGILLEADLIQAFENSEDAESEEETGQPEVVPAEIPAEHITEETEVE